MRREIIYIVLFSVAVYLPVVYGSPQATTGAQRDAQAVALLQGAVHAMGATPSDSVAVGNVTNVPGSAASTGSVRILTRGTGQTSEQVTLPQSTTTLTYSGGLAAQTLNSVTTSLSLELAASSQSVLFPLPFFAGALANPDVSIQYVGLETLNQKSVQHIRLRNSFASRPKLQFLADFTITDLWLDASSSLPQKVSYFRRAGRASEPRFQIDVYFSNYQNVGSVIYPFLIQKQLNGSPVMTITISTVSFNTGLTDTDFPVP